MPAFLLIHGGGTRGQQRVARERLWVELDTVPGAHCGYLSRPAEVADLLEAAWRDRAAAPRPAFVAGR